MIEEKNQIFVSERNTYLLGHMPIIEEFSGWLYTEPELEAEIEDKKPRLLINKDWAMFTNLTVEKVIL